MSAPDKMPVDAQCRIDGLYYKIGLHGRAFYWCGSEWFSSAKSVSVVTRNITSTEHSLANP